MKALNILDAETLYYSQICILIKLLHRHEFSKSLLLKSLHISNPLHLDLYEDIKMISHILKIDFERIIYYPDKTRELLIENYLNQNEDQEKINNIKDLLENFSYENKKLLTHLIKLNIVNNEDDNFVT